MDDQSYTPRPEVVATLPNVTGNQINGLNEADWRPPRPILWHIDKSKIAHGDLQDWFFANGASPGAREHMQINLQFMAQPQTGVVRVKRLEPVR